MISSTLNDLSLAESEARWGAPVTPTEEDYLRAGQAVQREVGIIEDYGRQNPSSYAGRYTDYNNGTTVHVAFTANADAHMAELRRRFPYPDKLRSFPAIRTLAELEALQDRIWADRAQLARDGIPVPHTSVSIPDNVVELGTFQPTPAMQQTVTPRYGPGVRVVQRAPALRRHRRTRPLLAGLAVDRPGGVPGFDCTLAFMGRQGSRYYGLTAGHCPGSAEDVRWSQGGRSIGRSVFNDFYQARPEAEQLSDSTAIRVSRRNASSRRIFETHRRRRTVTRVGALGGEGDRIGDTVCISGAATAINRGQPIQCGRIVSFNEAADANCTETTPAGCGDSRQEARDLRGTEARSTCGDSGAPIYQRTGRRGARAVGILSGALVGRECDFTPTTYSHIERVRQDIGVAVLRQRRLRR